MENINQVLTLIGGIVVTGGGLSLIVYQIFKHLAAKWLDARFGERLQALKHQHDKEIEELRFKISAMLDRATKLHQCEFEVLPEAWSKLNDSFWNARAFVSPAQSYIDIDSMPQGQQEAFISSCGLLEWQKVELRQTNEKTRYYQEQIFWNELGDAKVNSRNAYIHFAKNGIFIREDIRTKFSILHDLIWKALIEHQNNKAHQARPQQREKITQLLNDGEGLMEELERMVYQRLWPEERGI